MWAEKMNAWALELGRRGMDREEESVGVNGSPYPLIKVAGILRLPTCLVKPLVPPSAVIDGMVGLLASVLMRIP